MTPISRHHESHLLLETMRECEGGHPRRPSEGWHPCAPLRGIPQTGASEYGAATPRTFFADNPQPSRSDQKYFASSRRVCQRLPFSEKFAMPAPWSASATCQKPLTAPLRPADSISNPCAV